MELGKTFPSLEDAVYACSQFRSASNRRWPLDEEERLPPEFPDVVTIVKPHLEECREEASVNSSATIVREAVRRDERRLIRKLR